MASGTVAARVAKGLFDYAVTRGVDARALQQASEISSEQLEEPERRISLDAYAALMRAAARLSGDPAFALHFGEAVDVREMSLAAMIGQSLGTAADVLTVVNRYARLDIDVETEGEDRLVLIRERGKLWLADMRIRPNLFPELTESVFVRMVAAGRRIGLDLPISEVQVTHRAPAYRAEYDRIFRVPVSFGSERNAIALDPAALSQRIGLQPAYAGRIIEQRAETLLRELEATGSFRSKVEAAARPLLGSGTAVGAAAVARRLGMSRQTLYRRLGGEGTSFERTLDALRRQIADDLLTTEGLPLQEIAWRLGFADASSFSRAYKRWTGSSPGRVRRSAR